MKPFWLILALLSLLAAWRVSAFGRIGRVLAALLAVLFVLVGVDVIHLPNIEELVTQVGHRLGNWAYLLVGVNAFLETGAFLGFLAPGETMVLFGGVLAGEGTIELIPLIAVVWGSAMLGDLTSYSIGRRYGRDFLLRYGARVRIGEPQVAFVEQFFLRHGELTVLLGRWVGVVRPLVPFLAGSSRLSFPRFLAVDLVATFAWSALLCILGSVFWQNFTELTNLVGRAFFVLGCVIVLVVTVAAATSTRRSEAKNAKVERRLAALREDHPWVARPAGSLWALVNRLEPHVPGRKARRETPGEAGTVVKDEPVPSPEPPPPA